MNQLMYVTNYYDIVGNKITLHMYVHIGYIGTLCKIDTPV